MKRFSEWYEQKIIQESKKKKKWIQKAIKHPGRCKDFGGPDCPPGSPQYNLAKRFKKGDLHHEKEKE